MTRKMFETLLETKAFGFMQKLALPNNGYHFCIKEIRFKCNSLNFNKIKIEDILKNMLYFPNIRSIARRDNEFLFRFTDKSFLKVYFKEKCNFLIGKE